MATTGQPRVRRPGHFFDAGIGLLLIVWAVSRNANPYSWETAIADLVMAGPPWLTTLLEIGYLLGLICVLIVAWALIAGGPPRRLALRDFLIVLAGTGVLVVLLSFMVNGAWPYVLPEIDLQNPMPRFPVLRVAWVTAVLLTVSPQLTRPIRRFGWFAIATTAIASVGLGYGTPMDTLGSYGVGLFCAGVLLVIVGSPRGYPDPDTVAEAAAGLGAPVRNLEVAPYQTWGVVRFVGRDDDDNQIDVKVHGRDAFDSQLLAKVWHTLWYRETGRAVSFSRHQAVEHEALITLMAERAGVPVPGLAAVGAATSEISLIAFRAMGVALSDIEPENLTIEMMTEVWTTVRLMHDESLAHGSLDASAVQFGPDGPIITDFALGSISPDDADLQTDVVELLYSMAVLTGTEKATQSALRGLGHDRLVAALPYLQPPAVSPTTRRLADKPKKVTSELSAAIAGLTGAVIPEPAKLRRVTVRNVVMAGLLFLIATALVPLFTSVDYSEIWIVLQSADWAILVFALFFGHAQFPPQATATMFAVPAKLPFWPLLTLQTASQFISLAIPSAAGRIAMNAAFLQKFGVSLTVAVAQGAIDGFSGFLVQVAILLLVLLIGDVDLGLDLDPSQVPWLIVLVTAMLVVGGLVVTVLRVRALRDRIVPVVKQAWGALMVVLRQPSRAFGLLGSNFVYWNVLGLTLWLIVEAVGFDINYGSALFVAAGTSLLAGFMPVPGGIGVAEATMTALLITFGLDETAAFAVTAVYRVITFYLPALEGFFGTRWLEKHGYI